MHPIRYLGLGIILFCLFLNNQTRAIHAQTIIVVNATTDSIDANPGDGICADVNGLCTLRAAVSETNALTGQDTITLPAGTYTRSINAPLTISDDLILIGAGAKSTVIDAAEHGRLFTIATDAITIEIHNVTLTNGRTPDATSPAGTCVGASAQGGGAILLSGQSTLTVVGTAITNNRAGNGANTNGTAYDLDSQGGDGGSGGGILLENGGSLHLIGTTISDNTVGTGGLGNAVSGAEGDGTGIAINTFTGTSPFILTSDNSTIYQENSAATDIAIAPISPTGECVAPFSVDQIPNQVAAVTLTFTNSTIHTVSNFLAFSSGDYTLHLTNTIINKCKVFSDPSLPIINVISHGYNLIWHNVCTITSAENIGTDLIDVDPLVTILADYGGDVPTLALTSASPAIDAGSCPTLAPDQRGFSRRIDLAPGNVADGCDIGAFEQQVPLAVELKPVEVIERQTKLWSILFSAITLITLRYATRIVTRAKKDLNMSV